MTTEQEHTLMRLEARAAAALADLQVIILRDLAGRLRSCDTPAGCALRLEAAADQLEAAAREARRPLGSGQLRP